MTKYKEYLRAKGATHDSDPYNECDFEINTCAGIETTFETRIMDGCIVVIVYSNIADPVYAVYDKYGEHGWFDTHGDMSCIERFNCDPEYIDFLRDMGYDDSEWAFTVMQNTYEEHAKIRLAFKHMKAGIMDARTFYKLALRYRFY